MPPYHRIDAPWHKLTLAKIRKIKDLYATGEYTHKQLGEMFGVHKSNISRALNDQSFQNYRNWKED
jgi:hypothetical protein